jgi:hypothetical protein
MKDRRIWGDVRARDERGNLMKMLRILVASILGAACLVAAPATTAGAVPPPLTISCAPAPVGCTATGQLGSLLLVNTVAGPNGSAVVICLSRVNVCDIAGAVLVITPAYVFGDVGIAETGALVVLTAHALLVLAGVQRVIKLQFFDSNGVATLVAISKTHRRCLVVQNGTIVFVPC